MELPEASIEDLLGSNSSATPGLYVSPGLAHSVERVELACAASSVVPVLLLNQ